MPSLWPTLPTILRILVKYSGKNDTGLLCWLVVFLFVAYIVFVVRSAWQLLKPGGVFINVFSTKNAAYAKKFEKAQTRMWRDYSDDQHMWVGGAFFQFSAGEGWDELKGFDISPESAKDAMDESPLRFFSSGVENNVYAVQATKASQEERIDPDNAEKSFSSMMWMLPVLEVRDKSLLAPRLARAYQAARNDEERMALEHNIQYLPAIYESLVKMDTFEFGFNLQSQTAADIVIDPSFNANEEQIIALKQGTPTHLMMFCVPYQYIQSQSHTFRFFGWNLQGSV